MLARRLEPEVMDSREDAWDYDSMDHGDVNRRFVEDLLAAGLIEGQDGVGAERKATHTSVTSAAGGAHPGPVAVAAQAGQPAADEPEHESQLVLDIGTGTAQIPILLCRATEDVRIIGADAAVSMLDLARLNVEIAGLRERIQLDQADAKQLAYRDGMFDAVIANSIIHHIPEPREVLRDAVRVTKPGGLLFFRDLLRPASDDEVSRLVQSYAADCNEHQQMLFRNSLYAAFTVEEIQTLVGELGFPPETVRITSDRHWTWSARRV